MRISCTEGQGHIHGRQFDIICERVTGRTVLVMLVMLTLSSKVHREKMLDFFVAQSKIKALNLTTIPLITILRFFSIDSKLRTMQTAQIIHDTSVQYRMMIFGWLLLKCARSRFYCRLRFRFVYSLYIRFLFFFPFKIAAWTLHSNLTTWYIQQGNWRQ